MSRLVPTLDLASTSTFNFSYRGKKTENAPVPGRGGRGETALAPPGYSVPGVLAEISDRENVRRSRVDRGLPEGVLIIPHLPAWSSATPAQAAADPVYVHSHSSR